MTIDSARSRVLRKAFRMPSVQDMMSRKSSITNAFACAIVPSIEPTDEEIEQVLTILAIDPENLECAYCGSKATEWDHLRPLVVNRRATGYISEIANLVPACGKCNQSKGNKPWRDWMLSDAKHSPKCKGVRDVHDRIKRLENFQRWRSPRCFNVEKIVGSEAWNAYWSLCDEIIAEMRKAQTVADEIRAKVQNSIR